MPQFVVFGANKQNGRELQMAIEATSVLDAAEQANEMGLLVRDVQSVTAIAPAPPPPQYAQPARPMNYTATVHMVQRRSNSLGIASLILGILAFLICWIPIVAVVSLPLSALGIL